ncbi:hypothetical protein MMC15_001528 [Xylographa vitiligo]|nr:hypothetical protein [Xylographa vitiligo]
MFSVLKIVVPIAALFSTTYGNPTNLLRPPPLAVDLITPQLSVNDTVPATGSAFFEQLLDHDHPELGTFSQKYWYNSQYWAGPGSPVVLFTPGEIAAAGYTGYLTNETITGLYAEAIGGAVVLLEHRYWGDSSPYQELTTKNLQYLTLKNSIADLTHFASTVQLPFDLKNSSQAAKAPWVLSGGSYSGALSAWTESTAPGTFWAYHASSAPVEAIYDYWQYFYPVQQGMAQNCSSDVSLVIDHIDGVLTNGTKTQIQELKTMFGLQHVEHNDDFASALQNGPWLWQENSFTTGYSGFFQFCDFVEGVANEDHPVDPGPSGVGLTKALAGYAKWMNTTLLPGYCANYGYWTSERDVSCFDTYNATSPLFTDLSVGNTVDRQWQWFLCNEPFAYWQESVSPPLPAPLPPNPLTPLPSPHSGAPSSRPSIVSRLVTAAYWQRQCGLFFPRDGNSTTDGPAAARASVAAVNAYTHGWDIVNSTRLIWTNGQYDPWRTSGVSSQFRPGGPLASSAAAPLQIIPGGFHCSDLIASNGAANAGVQTVIENEVAQVKRWVAEFQAYV